MAKADISVSKNPSCLFPEDCCCACDGDAVCSWAVMMTNLSALGRRPERATSEARPAPEQPGAGA